MTAPLLNLFWEGTQFAYHSFARVNRALSLSLIRSGLMNLTLVPYEANEFAPDTYPQWAELQAYDLRSKGPSALRPPQGPSVWVRHVLRPRPNRPPTGMKLVAIQPWEYSVLPTVYLDALRPADELWTPSHSSRNALLNAGLSNVHVIPNGVDCDQFTPIGDQLPLPSEKRFKFLFVGGTIFRKGVDVLLASFCRAFNANDDVCLVIKDAGGSIYQGQKSTKLIEYWQAQPNAPEIVYLDQQINDTELAALYRACDVFVASYRGEGFCLPALEAMACGLPVIVTAGGATDDFCDEEVGWRIHATPRQLAGNQLMGMTVPAPAFVAEPDGEYLSFLMRQAYDAPQLVVEKGIAAALRTRAAWSWLHAARDVIARLDALCGTSLLLHADERLPIPAINSLALSKSIQEKQHNRL